MTSEAYSIYDWEPASLLYYPDSIGAEHTYGQSYESLQVEKTNEGWHALILEWEDLSYECEDDEDSEWGWVDTEPCYVMLDEKVFDHKGHAKEWLMSRDNARYEAESDREAV